MAQGDDDDDEATAKMTKQAWSAAMPEIRENTARMRATIAAFFGVAVEHLPPPQTLGWHRMLGTYVYGRRLRTHADAADELSRVLSGDLYDEKVQS
jgi:hypothetical protein